jgi:hypothetical protein
MESSKGLNTFESESMLGSLIFYAFIAILFFFIGRHYDRVTSKLNEQKENKKSKVRKSIFMTFGINQHFLYSILIIKK